MKKILILQGHPDGEEQHLCHALARAYRDGALSHGHNVQECSIAKLSIPFIRSQKDWQEGPVEQDIKAAQNQILWADHIVLIYPLWLGTMPAMLKAFLEQVMREGVVFEKQDKGLWKTILKGTSARIIVTMGMPSFIYRVFYRAHSLKSLERNILKFSGIKPIRETLIGSVENISFDRVNRLLTKMHNLGSNAS